MTPKERAAMQQALEALDTAYVLAESEWTEQNYSKAITALREALAEQAEQEPVAWMQDSIELYVKDRPDNWHTIPLHAAPVRTKDLTDEEITDLYFDGFSIGMLLEFARAVIAADREKNK